MKIMKITFGLSCAAVGAIVIGLFGAKSTQAGNGSQKPKVLFIQQDRIVTFDLTAPTVDQPLGGSIGAQVGTATGAINGTSVVNFKYTFTSNPFVRPLTFNFDNRVGITDTDGDQIIFKNVGTGVFNLPLLDPTVGGNPGIAPHQVFGNGSGGPLTGTYQVVATSGKYVLQYLIGQVLPARAISFNPASPPTPPGTTGSSYVEVFNK
jgi:hypothetical protein